MVGKIFVLIGCTGMLGLTYLFVSTKFDSSKLTQVTCYSQDSIHTDCTLTYKSLRQSSSIKENKNVESMRIKKKEENNLKSTITIYFDAVLHTRSDDIFLKTYYNEDEAELQDLKWRLNQYIKNPSGTLTIPIYYDYDDEIDTIAFVSILFGIPILMVMLFTISTMVKSEKLSNVFNGVAILISCISMLYLVYISISEAFKTSHLTQVTCHSADSIHTDCTMTYKSLRQSSTEENKNVESIRIKKREVDDSESTTTKTYFDAILHTRSGDNFLKAYNDEDEPELQDLKRRLNQYIKNPSGTLTIPIYYDHNNEIFTIAFMSIFLGIPILPFMGWLIWTLTFDIIWKSIRKT